MPTPPAALLRPFDPADLPAAADLWARCDGLGSSFDDQDSWRRFLEHNPGLSFAAEREGRLVGTVLAGSDGRRGVLYRLAVHPDERRSGLGRRLAVRALDALRARGIHRVLLYLFEDNAEGEHFWRALGAEPHPEIRFHTLDL